MKASSSGRVDRPDEGVVSSVRRTTWWERWQWRRAQRFFRRLHPDDDLRRYAAKQSTPAPSHRAEVRGVVTFGNSEREALREAEQRVAMFDAIYGRREAS